MRHITVEDVAANIEKLAYAVTWTKAREIVHALDSSVAFLFITSTSEYNDEGYDVDFVIRAYTEQMKPVHLKIDDETLIDKLGIKTGAKDYNSGYVEDVSIDEAFNFMVEPELPNWSVQ